MKESGRLTRKDFQGAMFDALDEGRFDISLHDLCRILGKTTGSFYSHYGEMTELHRDIAEIWLQDCAMALAEVAAKSENGVRDPLVSLRDYLAAVGAGAVRAATMRRWADTVSSSDSAWARSIPVVAAKVAELDQVMVDHLTPSLTHLGFTGRESADLARWLAAALQVPARARDTEGLETILDAWVRAVAFRPEGLAVTTGRPAPDAIRLYTTARNLPPGAQRSLNQLAREIARAQGGEEGPRGDGQAQAGQA